MIRMKLNRQIIDRTLRRILPHSLFGRSLLMILIPLLVTQMISLELFYGNYLNTVSRRLTDIVGGEVTYLVNQFDQSDSQKDRDLLIQQARQYLQYDLYWQEDQPLKHRHMKHNHVIGPVDEFLKRTLLERLNKPFFVDWRSYDDQVKISVQLNNGILEIMVAKKKLMPGSVWLFVSWIVGSACLLFMMASIFAWIQVKAIRKLSKAVEKFGKGRDVGELKPVGSRELRNAALAFNGMRERILRFVKQRTVVLASVSHDLRTPLTRLRLGLAMLPQKGVIDAEAQCQDIEEMIADTEEMEQMIASYLSFARGEGTEEPQLTDMVQLIEDAVSAASRAGTKFLSVQISASLPDMIIRTTSIRRVLTNILENARRYGGKVQLQAQPKEKGIAILIDDDGPGIPEKEQEKAFIPYETGNSQKGTGLGLSIAKNIIQGHGGDIKLENSPLGGLRVFIYIPR